MSIWSKVARLFTVDDTIMDEDFSLAPAGEPDGGRAEPPSGNRTLDPDEKVSSSLQKNRARIEDVFHLPDNADVIIRDFVIARATPVRACAVFMEGLTDKSVINEDILEPLMLLASVPPDATAKRKTVDLVKEKLVPANQVVECKLWGEVVQNIVAGSTVLFLDGTATTLAIETKGWEHRSVSDTKTETVVRGPHDAFTENLRVNTGLVRARLRTERLITQMMRVGELASTDIAVLYIEGLTNPKLIEEVRRRIREIKVDFLQDSGLLEQWIEDPPPGLVPKMMATERPDRVAQSLTEGYVVIFIGQSPYALIVPTVLWALVHTPEDAYVRFPFGSLIRLIRFGAFWTALLLPALYIAVTNYHPEMIPTDLMLTIAASREKVPFPVVVEVLLMEIAIELIREAGIRIPNVIGPTIGIVGALILGQAAVQAGIVSPLLVIVVAVTALSAFTLPNYNLSFAVRTLRFLFIFAAALWGFYGLSLGMMLLLLYWSSIKSFGVPILSPVAPYSSSGGDVILRGPAYNQKKRPAMLRPLDRFRRSETARPWDPSVHDSEEAKTAQESSETGGVEDA